MDHESPLRKLLSHEMRVPFIIALAQLVLQVVFHNQYGYFRDELYYIACSKHLAFGYVDQPPLSIFLLAITRWIAGDSLQAIRFLPSVAGAGVVLLAAMMAKKLSGGRFAQGLASFSVVAAHVLLGAGRFFSMNAFDVFFWALALYIVIWIVIEENPRLWLWFGVVAGLGLLNKYSVGFLCISLTVGLLLTPLRRHFVTRWFWFGVVVAGLLFLPHVIWEIANGFPSIEFMRNASQEKNVPTTFSAFLLGQFQEVNFLNAPLWLLGLYYFFFHKDGKRLRVLGWIYVVLFAIFVIGNGKAYYLAAIYPALLAGGAVYAEKLLHARALRWIKPVYIGMMALVTLVIMPLALPVLPIQTFIEYEHTLGFTPKAEERSSLGVLPQGYADEFGWEEMVAGIAKMYDTLTPEEKSQCVIYVRNYGEAGAIDFFGKKYGLPNALCAHNNYWLWGPGEKSGNVAIILGGNRTLKANLDDLTRAYGSVEPSFITNCDLCMPYENGRQFFICRGMRTTFQRLWLHERHYI